MKFSVPTPTHTHTVVDICSIFFFLFIKSIIIMPFADMCDAHFIYYYRTFQMNSFLFVCFLTQGGRYSIMPNGDLHVHYIQIDDNDRLSSSSSSSSSSSTSLQSSSSFSSSTTIKTAMFRCQTKHLLTGEIKQSANYGRLIVTGMLYMVGFF